MNNTFLVRGIERVGNLDGEIERPPGFKPAGGDNVLQSFAFQALHHDKAAAIVLADVVNGADVRMIQAGSRLRFALKAFERLRAASQIFGEEFERHGTLEAHVLGLIDLAHAARA